MRRVLDFLTNMDARAWRTVAISFLLFGGVGGVFLFAAPLLGLNSEAAVEQWLSAAHGVWALPVAVSAFAVLAFVGVPQFVLIAAAVVAFGPWTGIAYSWIGTMVSSSIGFWLGRAFGGRLIRDVAGEGVARFMKLIRRNGFMASLIVRLVPAAPFIVVNMAAGVALMRFRDFLGGTAIGIIPKIALTAFAGNSVVQILRGGGLQHVVLIALAAAIWVGGAFVARGWLRRREDAAALEESES
ncbi:MAG: TVP38/TMEM64 family protein [Caulobacter sp.]|nr:TVP38/TMEM64 family protein [Caulobacter sp.]